MWGASVCMHTQSERGGHSGSWLISGSGRLIGPLSSKEGSHWTMGNHASLTSVFQCLNDTLITGRHTANKHNGTKTQSSTQRKSDKISRENVPSMVLDPGSIDESSLWANWAYLNASM